MVSVFPHRNEMRHCVSHSFPPPIPLPLAVVTAALLVRDMKSDYWLISNFCHVRGLHLLFLRDYERREKEWRGRGEREHRPPSPSGRLSYPPLLLPPVPVTLTLSPTLPFPHLTIPFVPLNSISLEKITPHVILTPSVAYCY